MSTLQTPYNEFVEYPIGSGDLYRLPLEQEYVAPGTEYVSIQMHTGYTFKSAMIPVDMQVRCYVPGPYVRNCWLSPTEIEAILAVGNRIYLEVGNLDPVQVEADAVTGERAEVMQTNYNIQIRKTVQVTRVVPQGALINPIQPITRAVPVDEGCTCLFTNDPSCGQKLLFQLEKVA